MARKIGALWQKKDKTGKTYLTGVIEILPGYEIRISVLKNERKQLQKTNAPDWNIIYNAREKEKTKIESDL